MPSGPICFYYDIKNVRGSYRWTQITIQEALGHLDRQEQKVGGCEGTFHCCIILEMQGNATENAFNNTLEIKMWAKPVILAQMKLRMAWAFGFCNRKAFSLGCYLFRQNIIWIRFHGCKLITASLHAVRHLSSSNWAILIRLSIWPFSIIFSLQYSIQNSLERSVLRK